MFLIELIGFLLFGPGFCFDFIGFSDRWRTGARVYVYYIKTIVKIQRLRGWGPIFSVECFLLLVFYCYDLIVEFVIGAFFTT